MYIAQVTALPDCTETKSGRAGNYGSYYHYEFCFIHNYKKGNLQQYVDLSETYPITKVKDSRNGFTVLTSEINIISGV